MTPVPLRAIAPLRLAVGVATVVALVAAGVAVGSQETAPGAEEATAPTVRPSAFATTTAPTVSTAPTRRQPAPRVVRDHIAFGPARLAATAAYSLRHYGERQAALDPSMVVLHFTESDDYPSVRSHFAANEPSLGEAPGVCAHYVVEQDGTVHELVPPTIRCRHTVGLNHLAIGVEFVQASHGRGARWAVQQILGRRAQAKAGGQLVVSLQDRFGIPDAGVIGHAMANDANGFHDLQGWRNDHVDWEETEVLAFRRLLATS